jgi:hypothetical protein
MNGAVEDLLREGLDRLTEEVQVPPGVTGKARTHLRRKKIAVRAALAGGAAAVTAAAVVAAVVPGQVAPRPVQARTAAYVITRVANALATRNKVIQTETIFSAPYPPVLGWNYRDDMRLTQWGFIPPAVDPGISRAQARVHWSVGTTRFHGRRIYAHIDYRRHQWANAGTLGFVPNACTVPFDIVEFNGPAQWPAYIRRALSCEMFKVAGHAQVNGARTIKLVGSTTDRHFWSQLPHGEGRGPLRVDATLYVNSRTYLPVLAIWNNRTHYRDGRPLDGTVRQEITALPATPDNIAKANVTVPAGFRKVPSGALSGAGGWPYFTSG